MKAILLIVLAVALAIPSIYGVSTSLTVHSTGYMGVVGVFSDVNLTQPCTTLNWTTVFPGTTVNQTVYLKNFGGQNVNVTMTISNWNPLNASQYLTVTWDHQNAILTPGLAEQAYIYLAVSANAITSGIGGFSFDITINSVW